MSILTYKQCVDCGEWKEVGELRGDDYSLRCEPCDLKRPKYQSQQWKNEHPEAAKEHSRRAGKKHYWSNRDAILEKNRQRYAANPQKYVEYNRERKAKRKYNGSQITIKEWEGLKAFYNYTCLRCGKQEHEIKLTLDHILPVALGGVDSIENAQPLCSICNSIKHDKYIDYRGAWLL